MLMIQMSSAADVCHFPWLLMKSCLPNPQHLHCPSPISSTSVSISVLPEDLLLECLVRVAVSALPSLLQVCRRWARLVNSPAFHNLRVRRCLLSRTLFSICISDSALFSATLQCCGGEIAADTSWRVSTFVPSDQKIGSFSLFSQFRAVSVARKIYIIGRTAMLRYDTWTGKLVPKAAMGFPRKKFAAAVVGGKILVAGGCASSSAVEEYDPDYNEWRVVSEAPRRRYGCIGVSVDGLFYVVGGLKIGLPGDNDSSCVSRSGRPYVFPSSMDVYDAAAGVWLRNRTVPGGGCVVAACAAGVSLYILSSHAVELSFWEFNASRKSPSFGQWRKVKSPPVAPPIGVGAGVKFSCIGMGELVVLVQKGCGMWRKEGVLFVYDCAGGEWRRAADTPEEIRGGGAITVCVQW